jgi:uncharacterized protein YdhG (YjbR/CyaY superfamily)
MIARMATAKKRKPSKKAVSPKKTARPKKTANSKKAATPKKAAGPKKAARSKKAARPKKAAGAKPRRAVKTPSTTGQRAQKATRNPAIDAYLEDVNDNSRRLLVNLRETIHTLVPGLEECISYRLPAFRYVDRIIAGFAATAKGGSYYPFSGTTLGTLAADLEEYNQTKGALHFDAPLPTALVRKLLQARIDEG